jgi:hypothetical protein
VWQAGRLALLSAWKYGFEDQLPRALASSNSGGKATDRFYSNMLPPDRLVEPNPSVVALKVEQVLYAI